MELTMNVVGWAGMVMLVAAYASLTVGKLRADSLWYQSANLVGGVCLMANTAFYGAWPSAALNLVWFFIGAIGIWNGLRSRRLARATPPVGDLDPVEADRV